MEETKYQLLKNQKPYRILTAKEIADFFRHIHKQRQASVRDRGTVPQDLPYRAPA